MLRRYLTYDDVVCLSSSGRLTPSDVTIMTSLQADPNRVICSGTGLKFGYVFMPTKCFIDTRQAGPGELKAFCDGPDKKAFCDLEDHADGTFTLIVRAQDIGKHQLHIQYVDKEVPGSPFPLRISPASLVKVDGEGLKDGVLKRFRGQFTVQSHAAGPGEIKIRIGGPKGAYKMETDKQGRSLVCKYHPRFVGTYVIHVLWSGDPVPGSPFTVRIFHDKDELRSYQRNHSYS